MTYKLIILPKAQKHLELWKRSGQKKTRQKIRQLLSELTEHPRTGTGKPEQLRGSKTNLWSRRIDKKNRLIYRIEE